MRILNWKNEYILGSIISMTVINFIENKSNTIFQNGILRRDSLNTLISERLKIVAHKFSP